MTKILLMNIPGGPYPTDYPPIGISRVMEAIRPDLNADVFFYDLDYYRPSFEQIKEKIRSFQPKILAFSAILTPTYAYLKRLSLGLKQEFPDIVQVAGGEMTVIADIMLLKTGIDICVAGESEPAFSSLIEKLEKENFSLADKTKFGGIKGLIYLHDNKPVFTGPQGEEPPIRQLNYDLLSKFTDVRHFIHEITGQHYRDRINRDEIDTFLALLRKENLARQAATVFASKGCVGKCTFCHRFHKGYRVIDAREVIEHIKYLIGKFDTGMLLFQEENFGSDERNTEPVLQFLKEAGLNWAATAVRVTTVNDRVIAHWKDCGCVHINFGVESCSARMLRIMEKNATVEDNLAALRLCNKHRVATILGLVVGMPGETEETIEETIRNLATAIPDDMDLPYEICVNYFQAVPGTPGYDYAQRVGRIGTSPEEEERYIESLCEVGANDIQHYLNFTDYEKEETAYWKHYIFLELIVAYIRKHGFFRTLRVKKARRYKYAALYMLFPRPVRKFLLKYMVAAKQFGVKRLPSLILRKLAGRKTAVFSGINASLRQVNKTLPPAAREGGRPWRN